MTDPLKSNRFLKYSENLGFYSFIKNYKFFTAPQVF